MIDGRKFVAEFIGTFALVFIGAGSVLVDSITEGAVGLVGIGLAHGLVLLAMIYSLAGISGAHFNPAVTISMLAARRMGAAEASGYIASQLLGSVSAAFLLLLLFPYASATALYGFPVNVPLFFGIGVEAVLTFLLVMTVYGVAVSRQAPAGASGLAIGAVIICDIMLGGTQTGGAMNPARAFGPALLSGIPANHVIYWAGPIAGALLAALVSEYLHFQKKEEPKGRIARR